MVLTARGGGGGIGAMRIRILRVRRGDVVENVVVFVVVKVVYEKNFRTMCPLLYLPNVGRDDSTISCIVFPIVR